MYNKQTNKQTNIVLRVCLS